MPIKLTVAPCDPELSVEFRSELASGVIDYKGPLAMAAQLLTLSAGCTARLVRQLRNGTLLFENELVNLICRIYCSIHQVLELSHLVSWPRIFLSRVLTRHTAWLS